MKAFTSVDTLEGWGAFDDRGFRLEESVRDTFASVCVLESHGSFTVTVNRYEVRVGDRNIEVTVDWDPETGSRFGTAA